MTKKQKKKIESDQRKREVEMKEIAAALLKKQEQDRQKQAEKDRKAEEHRKKAEKENCDFAGILNQGFVCKISLSSAVVGLIFVKMDVLCCP